MSTAGTAPSDRAARSVNVTLNGGCALVPWRYSDGCYISAPSIPPATRVNVVATAANAIRRR